MTWSRPQGDLKIWDTFETTNSAGKKFRFIIQEIPENRYEEALDHLCTNYLRYEDMRMSLNVVNDPDSVAYNRGFWKAALNQRISIGAFEVNDNNRVPTLAGLNVLRVIDKDSNKIKMPITSNMIATQKMINFVLNAAAEVDPCNRYGVDYFLTGTGLDINPHYSRLGLGTRLLLTREKVGRAYNIPVTSTMFSSLLAQKTAEKAGFVDILERGWDEVTDDHGELLFPGLKGLRWKIMEKKLL
ncbi:uncharacterized protein LOC130671456 isoform X2 [Microplitis mediator]|uniref:uncharacterized protein LOC130671456 isoform X2 n=1 Tax=Microplitis mediator TaxID=375433 RepID=UPI002552767D|nr:uncharacterized protein LOC130671456 isoform X2 [Microplitis mediator]